MIKFFHVRNKEQIGKGGITYALELDDKYTVLRMAKAVCNPKDNFNKRVGRVMAQGRLNSPRYVQEVRLPYQDVLASIPPYKETTHSAYSICY